MRFEPPSIKQRGQMANAMAAAYSHKPAVGEFSGRMACTRCGSALRFTIMANGLSRGQCAAAGCIKWVS